MDVIPNFWVEDRIRTGLEDGIRPKNGFGGRDTAQNKAELEDEIDPQIPSLMGRHVEMTYLS